MRLLNICSRREGNAYLPKFMADFNRRFAEPARSSVDAHRKLTVKDNLARILTWQETRTLSKNLTLQFENVVYQIQTQRPTYALRQALVTVCVDLKQNIILLYKGKPLTYNIFHKHTNQSQVILAKDINKSTKSISVPAPDHPWRKGFARPLSKNKSVPAARGGDTSTLEFRWHFYFGLTATE